MSSQPQLAPELLVHIFYLLPPPSRRVCLSVCRSWRDMAKVAYFSEISVLNNTDVSNLTTTLQTNEGFVKSMKIDYNRRLIYPLFIELITACPSLLRLKLNPLYCHWFSRSGLTLRKLKSVSPYDISTTTIGLQSCYRNLYRIAHRHSSSIEDLTIRYSNDLVIQREFNGVMEYLSRFETLKYLKLVNGHLTSPDYFDTVLTSCKTLQELYINYSNPLYPPATTVSNELERMKYTSMRRLGIMFSNFSTEYLQYIMDKFVNLTVLFVSIREIDVLDWDRSEQYICHFMKDKFIPFTKSLSRSFFSIKMNGSSSLGTLSAQFLCEYNNVESVRFDIKSIPLIVKTYIDIKTNRDSATLLHFTFYRDFSLDENRNLPYEPHLTNYGDRISSLEIQSSQSINFEFIMDHACNLKRLVFQKCSLEVGLEPPFVLDTTKLKKLQVFELEADYFCRGSACTTIRFIIATNHQIKHYAMKNKHAIREISQQEIMTEDTAVVNFKFDRDVKVKIKTKKSNVLICNNKT